MLYTHLIIREESFKCLSSIKMCRKSIQCSIEFNLSSKLNDNEDQWESFIIVSREFPPTTNNIEISLILLNQSDDFTSCNLDFGNSVTRINSLEIVKHFIFCSTSNLNSNDTAWFSLGHTREFDEN